MKYIITGGAGFIGSVIVGFFNEQGIDNIIVVDHLDSSEKWRNLVGKRYIDYLDRGLFLNEFLNGNIVEKDDLVIHMGACSSTTETDSNYIMENNSIYTKKLFDVCQKVGARLIYASSAATYGNGEQGYSDYNFGLFPLNMYGYSKQLLDQWVIRETNNFHDLKNQVVGLKFFNVYGPNEYHKGSMASMVFHGFNQIKQSGTIGLFKSYRNDYEDGMQSRDFIYVKDIAKVIFFLSEENRDISGIYNLGTGISRTFYDLAKATFLALGLEPNIYFKDMPETLMNKYQYYTQAEMKKLRVAGYKEPFYSLEDGVKDYVLNYLNKGIKTY